MQAVIGTVRKFVIIFQLSVSCLLFVPTVNAANIDSRIFNFQQKMANAGNAKAQFKLAYMYETGRGVNRDLAAARKWYSKSLNQKFMAAGHRLTFLDVEKSGFLSKHRSWVNTVIRDANNGDDNVMFLLANMYEKGIGVKSDLKKARHYYQRSTAKGNADAESRLFALDQHMRKVLAAKDKQRKLEQARKKADAEKLAKQKRKEKLKAKQASIKNKKTKILKAEKEKQRLHAERKKLADERKKLAKMKLELAKKRASQKKAEQKTVIAETKANKSEDEFEADLCTGKAARFRTQCN